MIHPTPFAELIFIAFNVLRVAEIRFTTGHVTPKSYETETLPALSMTTYELPVEVANEATS
jgi:hypothetical protein